MQLKRIHDTRQSQAEQQQQFMNPQQPQIAMMQQQMALQGMSQNQFQQQSYPTPQQTHVQNLGNPMQHHAPQSQRPVQSGNPIEMQQNMTNGPPVPNMNQRALQPQGQSQFSPQEQAQIMQMAEHMAQNLTQEQMQNVQRLIMSLPVEQRQLMQSQGINPAHAVFRQHAVRKFLQDRSLQQQRAAQGTHPLERGGAVSQQGRPPSQIPMHPGQPLPPQATPQHHEPSFDQFLGQQQEALRHQEAGQVVVPASQGAPPQVRGTAHPQQQGQFGARPVQPPHNFQQQPPAVWNTPQGQHPNIPPTTQPQIPPQTSNVAHIPRQTPQQQALQGQLGGLDNSHAQQTPQQNPKMPTLNRPLNPPSQAQNAQRQGQPNPKTGALNNPSGQQAGTVNGQPNVGQPPMPPNVQKFHKYVSSMPEPQRTAFLIEFKKRQEGKRAENVQSAAQSGSLGASVAPMGGQGSKAQSTPKPNPSIVQPPPNPVNRPNGQAQVSQQPAPSNEVRNSQQKFAPIALDQNTTRMMDAIDFPRSLLSVAGANAKVPEQIKNWGQLKLWVHQNSQILPTDSLQKIVGLQSIVYQQKAAQNHQQNALNQGQLQGNPRPTQPGVAPAAQMVAPNSSQASMRGSTAPVPNSSMPVLPPPTMQEVAAARAQLPAEVKGVSDEQLRQMISNKKQLAYLKAMQGQPNLTLQQQQLQHQQQQQYQNLIRKQQSQSSLQPNPTSQLPTAQRGQNHQSQPGQQWQQSQAAQKVNQSNAQQPKLPQTNRSVPQASGPQPNQKIGRRPNTSDDVVEVPDPKLSQQPTRPSNIKPPQPQPQLQPPVNNASAQMTLEKYKSLTPEQKARFPAAQRAGAQRLGQNVQGQSLAEAVNQNVAPNPGRDVRVNQLKSEIMRHISPRQPVPMSPNTRARMIEKLKTAGVMSQRLEHSLPLYLSLSKDEEKTKELLRSVCKHIEMLEFEN